MTFWLLNCRVWCQRMVPLCAVVVLIHLVPALVAQVSAPPANARSAHPGDPGKTSPSSERNLGSSGRPNAPCITGRADSPPAIAQKPCMAG